MVTCTTPEICIRGLIQARRAFCITVDDSTEFDEATRDIYVWPGEDDWTIRVGSLYTVIRGTDLSVERDSIYRAMDEVMFEPIVRISASNPAGRCGGIVVIIDAIQSIDAINADGRTWGRRYPWEREDSGRVTVTCSGCGERFSAGSESRLHGCYNRETGEFLCYDCFERECLCDACCWEGDRSE